jgi:DNA repair protein RecN (Recombination protein N)
MLLHLDIQNLAIIDHVELDFEAGLNVITGETGAGKSLLLSALDLILGGRADRTMVRKGADRAVVQALFRVDATSSVAQRLAERDLVDRGPSTELDIVIRRIVTQTGRARASINGGLVTVRDLQSLTRGLIDITGQHDHADLLNPETHLRILDAYAGLEDDLPAMAQAMREQRSGQTTLDTLAQQHRDQASREDYLRFQIATFETLDPQSGESAELRAEHARLSHAEALVAGSRQAESNLTRRQSSVIELLTESARNLELLAEHDPELGRAAARIEAARIELDDIAHDMARYSEKVEQDPNRLHHVAERLDSIQRLAKRHGLNPDDLGDHHLALRSELSAYEDMEQLTLEATRAYEASKERVSELASLLSRRRQGSAVTLSSHIERELKGLGMDDARVEIRVTDRTRPTEYGMDQVEIFVETNAGEGLHPLKRVASGGELSRLTLAIQGASSGVATIHTAIYDEVDTGVGGAIAEAIGLKLRSAASGGQAIVITHMPQIAALGVHHLAVQKEHASGRVHTRVVQVSGESRSVEIARMLGGARASQRVSDHAAELLDRARQAA